ncbi:hypothetical protein E1H18_1112 [Caulobacter sp. RHG1]|nr:hypothetical protein [Caulobacter sp. RHG1]
MAAMAFHARALGGETALRISRRGGAVRRAVAKLMVMLVAMVFVFGVVVCGPAEHEAMESLRSTAPLTLTIEGNAPAVLKDSGERQAPAKSTAIACTGHCVTHGLSLPTSFAAEAVAVASPADWRPEQDSRPLTARADLLDRPPRA